MSAPDWLQQYADQQGWNAPDQPAPQDVADLQAYADTFGPKQPSDADIADLQGTAAALDQPSPVIDPETGEPVQPPKGKGARLMEDFALPAGLVDSGMGLSANAKPSGLQLAPQAPPPSNDHLVEGAGTAKGFANALAGAPDAKPADAAPKQINFATPSGSSGANGAPAEPQGGGPVNIPQARMVGGGYARTISPEAVKEADALTASKLENAGNATVDARLANQAYAQEFAKHTAELQAQREQAQNDMILRKRAADKAEQDFQHASALASQAKVDPSKVFSDGGKVAAIIGVALGAIGSSLTKGPNFAQEMIDKHIENELAAQKENAQNARSTAQNAWQNLKEKTGSADQADNMFRLAGLEVYKSKLGELGANAQDKALEASLADKQDAIKGNALAQRLATEGRVPGGVVGGITPEDVKRARAIRDQAATDGKDIDPNEAMRQALAERGVSQTGGFQSYAKANTRDANAHARALGTMAAYQKTINEANEGEKTVDDMIAMVKAGGQLDKSRTKKGQFLRDSSINSMATIMANGSKPGDKEIDMATRMHPDDPNSFQGTGADLAQLLEAKAWYQRKREASIASMKQLHDDPFAAPADASDIAASAGATKD